MSLICPIRIIMRFLSGLFKCVQAEKKKSHIKKVPVTFMAANNRNW